MSSDQHAPLRAAVLSATLMLDPGPADPFVLRAPAIRRIVPRIAELLDLDAAIYRYRIDIEGNVSVLCDAVGARSCSGVIACVSESSGLRHARRHFGAHHRAR